MKIVRVLGIVVVLLVIAIVATPFLIDVNQFRPRLEAELSSALGRTVSVGNLKLSILGGSVEADDLSIGDDPAFSKTPFVRAKSLSVGVELMPLITSRKVNVTGIVIDQPEIELLQNVAGKWNYATLGSKSAAPAAHSAPSSTGAPIDLSVKLIKINNGRLTSRKIGANAKTLVLEKVNIQLKDFASTSVMPFSLSAKLAGGGDLTIDGKMGPLHVDDLEQTPVDVKLALAHCDLLGSGLTDPSVGIAGIVSIDANGDSDGKRLVLKGKIKAEQLKVVKGGSPAKRPVEFDFALNHNLASHNGSLTQGDVHIGKAVASLTGTYTPHGESVAIKANLVGSEMVVTELESLLPALNIALPAGATLQSGTATTKLSVEGPLNSLVSTGSLGLSNAKLAGFDFGKKMAVIETLAGIKSSPDTEIQVLSANVRNGNDGTTIEDLKFVVANVGELTGTGTVNPSQALDFKMKIAVKNASILPVALASRAASGIPFFIRGTAADPKFEPDVKGMAAAELNNVKGTAVKAAEGLLDGLLGGKKKQQQ